jgi:hypothetical protein
MKKHYLLLLILLFGLISRGQIINFPDANFKARLMLSAPSESIGIDINGNYVRIDANFDNEIDMAEAAVIYSLNVGYGNINSLEGIENFVNLRSLSCDHNNLTQLAVASLTNLLSINCGNNQLTSLLPLQNLINLVGIYCVENQLTSLSPIENLTQLEDFQFGGNQIQSVNLQNLHVLWRLWCEDNLLTEIDLCGTAVKTLWCNDNPFLHTLKLKNNIVSTPQWKVNSAQIPPIPPNFYFLNLPSLNTICYDEGEYNAVVYTLPSDVSFITFSTTCQTCTVLDTNETAQTIFSIYPNPVDTILNITAENDIIKTVTIYNLIGQKVITFTNQNAVDLSSLSKGAYFITVETDKGTTTRKIIKI